ncbi:hypothetical protein ACFVAJ_17515 [Agromyces sp. NPDC057679]|uniref:hypothetical protein n=1 Tax=Agromyces sp. NPDC057679 TaxID=3346207 RepID=UPI00366C34D2
MTDRLPTEHTLTVTIRTTAHAPADLDGISDQIANCVWEDFAADMVSEANEERGVYDEDIRADGYHEGNALVTAINIDGRQFDAEAGALIGDKRTPVSVAARDLVLEQVAAWVARNSDDELRRILSAENLAAAEQKLRDEGCAS